MATTVAPETVSMELPERPLDWRRLISRGLLGALTGAFIVSIGMLETFNERILIVPIISLGYAVLYMTPVVFGYVAAAQLRLPGDEGGEVSSRHLISGVTVGLVSGLGLWLFTLAIDTFDISDIFIRLTVRVVDLVTFGRGFAFGLLVLAVGWSALGAVGGALAGTSPRVRSGVTGAFAWTFAVAILELIVEDILDEIGLTFVSEFLYDVNGGLTIPGAIVVALLAGFLSWRYKGAIARSRIRVREMGRAEARRYWRTVGLVAAVGAIILPTLVGSLVNELFANVALFLLMGLGLNIVVGYAGLLDLGYVAFFAVGAYTTAILTSPISPRIAPMLTLNFASWEGWLIVAAVIVMAAIAGLLVGTPVIRMRGDYLAIVTLGFGEIVRILFLSDWLAPTFGGAQGVRQIPGAEVNPPGVDITGINPQSIVYFAGVFVVIAIYISYRLSRSRLGRAWAALREDESVAEAMGIDTVKVKLLAFVVGAILAAFGGMVFAVKVGSVFPNSFALLVSIIVLVVVIVGGMGSIPGVIVGAFVLIGILGGPTQPGVLQEFQEFKLLIYGALLVYMMLQRPEGLVPSVRRSRELHHDEMLQDAWLAKRERPVDAEEEAQVSA